MPSPWLVLGHDEPVAEWVRRRIYGVERWNRYRAIGVALGPELIAGVVYTEFDGINCQMSIAAASRRWATPRTLRELFAYPLVQLKCRRVYSLVAADAEHVRGVLDRLGFKHEGTLREAFETGDAAIYGMLKRECRWIRESVS